MKVKSPVTNQLYRLLPERDGDKVHVIRLAPDGSDAEEGWLPLAWVEMWEVVA